VLRASEWGHAVPKKATEVLRQEHEEILHILEAADQLAAQFEANGSPPPQQLSDLLEFFQLFADRCHHGKEEELLFPALEKKGMPRNAGPTAALRFEHEEARSLIRQMQEAGKAHAAGDSAARRRWAAAARAYSDLLRQHIRKENEILFVMAERLLSDAEQQQLASAFVTLEWERMRGGTHERLQSQMNRLLAELLPPKT
jgi:hemerythrin-like domain-containing protein